MSVSIKMSDSDDPEITEAANAAIAGLLPKKSKEVYEHTYHIFSEWCKGKKCPGKVNENILLAYFVAKSKTVKSSTLWSTNSMLKATTNIKHNIDISKFNKLVPFLKRMSDNYKPKKSKTFTREGVNKFLLEAEDETYLFMKVLLIMGISGAMRREELTKMTIDKIQEKEDLIIVEVPYENKN
ncbi:unnamed protein product [Tenebrio molitor]|nr:unnamed protein product [Tenebrio molitor]